MVKKTIKKTTNIIKAISIIDYIYGALLIVGGVFFFLGGTLLASLGVLKNLMPQMFSGIMGGMLVFASVIMLAIGVLYVILGKAITQYKLWAKIVQIILAILGLFSFPIGTAIGIFVLWALLINKETKDLFK